MPSAHVSERPLRAGRFFRPQGPRELWGVHSEDGQPPNGGFRWRIEEGGEPGLLLRGFLEMAILITHDCEIENDDGARTMAMIRPASHLDEKSREAVFSGREDEGYYAIFPLEAQDDAPKMERSFVDFRRLTTVLPAVLDSSTRVASASDELRRAIAQRFKEYLFRRIEPAAPTG